MIPKVIHYCWFGGNPLPETAKNCIQSWKKFCPDYEIKEWNENNFDINCCDYVRDAYKAKKWAFVSDYARFQILYKYGGVYFDTDVEIIRPIDEIIADGPFMGLERYIPVYVAPGLGLAAYRGMELYKEILDFYQDRQFKKNDGSLDMTTVVVYVTNILEKYGLKDVKEIQKVAGVNIYPVDYFCPIDIDTMQLVITENTYTIHHFDGSWLSLWQRIRHQIKICIVKVFGFKFLCFLRKYMG